MAFKRRPPADDVRRVINLGNNFRAITTNKRGQSSPVGVGARA